MKAIACLLAAGSGACLDNASPTVDEVIPFFEVVSVPDAMIADDHSPIIIQICTTDGVELDPELVATLKTSAGRWQTPDLDPGIVTVPMSHRCEQRALIPGADPGSFSITGTIDGFTKTLLLTLKSAPIDRVRLGRQGLLSPTSASTLTITANLDVLGNGRPSTGTLVTFQLTGEASLGSAAFFSDRELRSAQGNSVQTTLSVAPGVTQLTVTATAAPDGQPTTPSDPLVITP